MRDPPAPFAVISVPSSTAASLPIRRSMLGIGAALLAANLAVWAAVLVAFAGRPGLLGAALLAYGLGLRHALDADHLAVIDNVVLAAVEQRVRPIATGLWFALGHSTVVVAVCVGVASAAAVWRERVEAVQRFGETVGPVVSSTMLVAVALMNTVLLVGLWRQRREPVGRCTAGGGLVSRGLRPWRARLLRGGLMFPVGVLMGLGFDTASEIALLGLTAAQAAHGLPLLAVLAFPALFAAGMALVDTLNGWLMLGTYRWAADDQGRRFLCNVGATLVSITVALAIGGWQLWAVANRPGP